MPRPSLSSELAFILFFAKTLTTRHVLAWSSGLASQDARTIVRNTSNPRYCERQLFSLRLFRACKYLADLEEICGHATNFFMNTVGDRIKSRRQELGWTQEQLAGKAGISKGFLSDLETGTRNVSAEYLLKIAQALTVTLDFLMKGDPSKPKTAEVQIPARLSNLAKHEHLTFAQTLMLLDMRLQIKAHRSNSHSDDLEKFDWERFYEAVKQFLK